MKTPLFMLLLAASSALADTQAVNRIVNGDFAAPNPDPAQIKEWNVSQQPGRIDAKIVDAEAGDYKKALSVQVAPNRDDAQKPWQLSVTQGLQFAMKRGTPLTLRVWMRSPDRLRVNVLVQEGKPPYPRSLDQNVQLSAQWKDYDFRGRAVKDYAGSDTSLIFILGYGKGTVEIAGVRLVDKPTMPKDLK
jgi:hypothetical protein